MHFCDYFVEILVIYLYLCIGLNCYYYDFLQENENICFKTIGF